MIDLTCEQDSGQMAGATSSRHLGL